MATRWTKEGGDKQKKTKDRKKDKHIGRLHRGINTVHEYSCTHIGVCVHVTYTVVAVHAVCKGLDFKFKQVLESDIYKLLKNIDGKKSIDKIPPILVQTDKIPPKICCNSF